METQSEARATIHRELTSDDAEVRAELLKLFEVDINLFVDGSSRVAGS